MEGDNQRQGRRRSKGKGTTGGDTGRIQEYDFFVSQDGDQSEKADQGEEHSEENEKVGCDKSMDFFLSD